MNKSKKILIILLLTFSLGFVFALVNNSLAQTITTNDLGVNQISSTIGLPTTDIRLVVARIIRTALGLLGLVALVIVLYGGFMWMTAGGSEDRISMAKKILFNGIIGLVIILSSYAIVSFVMNKLVDATTGSVGGGAGGGTTVPPGSYFNQKFFYLVNTPNGGDMCIRNVKLTLTFNQDVDKSTLKDNVVVYKKSDSKSLVSGSWDWISSSTKYTVAFTPDASCEGVKGCYDASTDYVLHFENAGSIKTTEKIDVPGLLCSMSINKTACNDINFKTGSGVDKTSPVVTKITATPPLQAGRLIPVQIDYSDDNGIQKMDLLVDGKLAGSGSPDQNCQKSGTITINWNTSGLSSGSYDLTGIAYDWAALTGSNTTTVKLLPEHCFNSQTDGDEEGLNCGGKDCYACDITRIIDYSPKAAAPGNYLSISGYRFGTSTGKVYMQDTTGKWNIEAKLADCGINAWSDRQIIVEIPEKTVSSTPIQVVTADTKSDATNDSVLPALSNLTVNNINLPGVCAIVPIEGEAGTTVTISGKNFGTTSGKILFGDKTYATVLTWVDGGKSAYATARVPSMGSSIVSVRVQQSGAEVDKGLSNGVAFKVKSFSSSTLPTITNVTPSDGAQGEYITIAGSNFGSNTGVVHFIEKTDSSESRVVKGTFDFPTGCKGTWSDNKIIVKFPKNAIVDVKKGYVYRVRVTSDKSGVSAQSALSTDTFTIKNDSPRPGICGIEPVSGPIPLPGDMEIIGEYFDKQNSNVYFWQTGASTSSVTNRLKSNTVSVSDLTIGQSISTTPHTKTNSGPVIVDSSNLMSNAVNFEVFDCASGQKQCGTGTKCCKTGTQKGVCISETKSCAGEILNTAYVWRFSTGIIPKVPAVKEQCYTSRQEDGSWPLPSPSPSEMWNSKVLSTDQNKVCLNSTLVVDFTTKIDAFGIGTSIIVNECVSTTVSSTSNNCTSKSVVKLKDVDSGSTSKATPLVSSKPNAEVTNFIELAPTDNNGRWKADTWYQVVLKDDIGYVTIGKSPKISKTRPCTVSGSAYCFMFKTGANDCKLKGLYISPYSYTTTLLQKPIADLIYRAHGMGDQNCVVMNVSGFTKQWAVEPAARSVYADIHNKAMATGTTVQVDSLKNSVGVGLKDPDDAVNIKATFTTTSLGNMVIATGTSPLKVDLTNPQVLDYGPKCSESCPNSSIWVKFNTSLSNVNLSSEFNAFRLYSCLDENCLEKGPIPVKFKQGPNDGIFFGTEGDNILEMRNLYLATNTTYLVEVSKTTQDTTDPQLIWTRDTTESSQRKPYTKLFSWRFTTKTTNCTIDRVQVIPQKYLAKSVTDRTVFSAQAYSAPDTCSVVGQKINEWKYNWGWSSSDLNTAIVKPQTTYGSRGYCTSNCIRTGSDVAYTSPQPLCGNGILEAGEDCELPDGLGGCGLNCLFTGNINTTTTPSSTPIGLCGDGHVEPHFGEECDPNDKISQLGCDPKTCLRKGSSKNTNSTATTTSVCGNNKLGFEEECELGNISSSTIVTSSMYCTDKCLHQGTSLFAGWCELHDNPGDYANFATNTFKAACQKALSRCGDGIDSPDEDPGCDSKGGIGKWCGYRCLLLDVVSTTQYQACLAVKGSLPDDKVLCRDCTPDAEGCSKGGQNLGSSIYYKTPTFCGDKKPETGEDDICETDNLVLDKQYSNPWTYVEGVGNQKGFSSVTAQEQKSDITASTSEGGDSKYYKTGKGEFAIACGYNSDSECAVANGDNYGLAKNTCCYRRPQLTSVYPGSTSTFATDVCPNTAIEIGFNEMIDANTLPGNVIIAKGFTSNNSTNCGTSTNDVTNLVNLALLDDVHQSLPWYKKIIYRIADFFRNIFLSEARAQTKKVMAQKVMAQWCAGSTIGTPNVSANITGGSTVSVILSKPLDFQSIYTVVIKKEVRDVYGVSVIRSDATKYGQWQFETGSGICKLEKIEVTPSQIYFDKRGATSTVKAEGLTASKAKIQPISGYYNWQYAWDPFVNVYVTIKEKTTTKDPNLLTALNREGETYVRATGEVTEDQYNTGTKGKTVDDKTNVILYFCENPWPPKDLYLDKDGNGSKETGPLTIFPFEDIDDIKRNNDGFSTKLKSFDGSPLAMSGGYFNYRTYYCADNGSAGLSDDLPYLEPAIEEAKKSSAMKTYIFTSNKSHNGIIDAVFAKIFTNPTHLKVGDWYKAQGFTAAVTLLQIDGYDAITDGLNYYIDALNLYTPSTGSNALYSNIYLFGVNSNASTDTKTVFTEMMTNLKFNINVTNYGYCGTKVAGASTTCKSDLDCAATETCFAATEKLKNNYQRLKDLRDISGYLNLVGSSTPNLSSGSLLNGQSLSTWSSWVSTLGSALQKTLPTDPVNKMGRAGTCKFEPGVPCQDDKTCQQSQGGKYSTSTCVIHDAATSWSTVDLRLSFACNQSSLAYRYIHSTSTDYQLRAKLESPFNTGDLIKKSEISNWWGTSGFVADFIDNKKVIVNSPTGICTQADEISSRNSGYCGDGAVSNTEDCEGSQEYKWTTDCTGSVQTMRVWKCNAKTCQWDKNGSASCSSLSVCGDGSKESGEDCDDGSSNGEWNKCNKWCQNFALAQNQTEKKKDKPGGTVLTGTSAESYSSQGYCGDSAFNNKFEVCDYTYQSKWNLYDIDKNKSCSTDCKNVGMYCGDGIIQNASTGYVGISEACEADISCTTTLGKVGVKACDLTNATLSKRCQFKDNGICTTTAITAPIVTTASGTCGDGTKDDKESCDWGIDKTKPLHNNKECTPEYGKSCSYCDKDCNVAYKYAAETCGDGIVQSKYENCDVKDGVIYAAATNTAGAGQVYTPMTSATNGFQVKTCAEEKVTGEAWTMGNSIQGTKTCSVCKLDNKCIECGIDMKTGVTISGQLLNALDPKTKNPLLVNNIGSSNMYSGTIDLHLVSGQVTAKALAPSVGPNDLANGYTLYLPDGGGASTTVAKINSNSLCSFGTSAYTPNYMIAFNAGWKIPVDFNVLSEEAYKKAPYIYDFVLSPMILSKDRSAWYHPDDKDAKKVQKREHDVRIVVSWVDNTIDFQSGFAMPIEMEKIPPPDPTTPITELNITQVKLYESTSYFTSKIVNGLTYYQDLKNATPKIMGGIWYHGFNYTPKGDTAVESYTIDTNIMGSGVKESNIYAFYIRTKKGDIRNYQSTAQLRVDIYIPEDYISKEASRCCSDSNCSAPTSTYTANGSKNFPLPIACRHDYRLMGQPYKTIYLSTAANSQSSSQIQYWHVLNLKEDLDLTKPDSNIEVVNAISTGPDRFSYTYADKYINK